MIRGVMASSQPCKAFPTSIDRGWDLIIPRSNPSFFPNSNSNSNSNSFGSIKSSRMNLRCKSIGDSGENVYKSVLDAFFLGKAIGEVLNERIGSTLGEFVGVVGRFQTEQLKFISQFQEEVLEKASRAKAEAALGLVSGATSTVKEATEEVISEAASIVKDATQEVITEAASVVREATQDVISEAASTAKEATRELVSGAASTAEQATGGLISDAASTISSITGSLIPDGSSSLLNKDDDPFLGFFNKD